MRSTLSTSHNSRKRYSPTPKKSCNSSMQWRRRREIPSVKNSNYKTRTCTLWHSSLSSNQDSTKPKRGSGWKSPKTKKYGQRGKRSSERRMWQSDTQNPPGKANTNHSVGLQITQHMIWCIVKRLHLWCRFHCQIRYLIRSRDTLTTLPPPQLKQYQMEVHPLNCVQAWRYWLTLLLRRQSK